MLVLHMKLVRHDPQFANVSPKGLVIDRDLRGIHPRQEIRKCFRVIIQEVYVSGICFRDLA